MSKKSLVSHSLSYYASYLQKEKDNLLSLLDEYDESDYLNVISEDIKKFDTLIKQLFISADLNEANYLLQVRSIEDNDLKLDCSFEPSSLESVLDFARTYIRIVNGSVGVSHSIDLALDLDVVSDSSSYSILIPHKIVLDYIQLKDSQKLLNSKK